MRYTQLLFLILILSVETVAYAQFLPIGILRRTTASSGIAFDASSASGTAEAMVSSVSWSHTVTAAGSNRVLVVAVLFNDYSNGAAAPTITSVTYNGTAMTGAGSISRSADHSCNVQFFYLAGPATGAHNVVITLNKAPGNTINGNLWGVAASYTGVSQVSPLDAHNEANAASTAASSSITTVADNAWIIGAMVAVSTSAFTANNSYSIRQSYRGGVTGTFVSQDGSAAFSDSNGPKTPAGAITQGFTVGNNYWALQLISLTPF